MAGFLLVERRVRVSVAGASTQLDQTKLEGLTQCCAVGYRAYTIRNPAALVAATCRLEHEPEIVC